MGMRLGLVGLDFDSPEEAVEEVRARGLPLLELYVSQATRQDDAAALLRAHRDGVAVHSVSSLAKLAQAEDDLPEHVALIRHSIAIAAEVGAPYVTFMYGGSQHLDRHGACERFLRRLEPLAAEAAGHGVGLLVENVFSRSPVGDLDSVEWTLVVASRMEALGVGLNFDVGNYAIAGEEAFPFAWGALRRFVRAVHLKDVCRYVAAEHGPLGSRRGLDDHVRGRFIATPLGWGSLNALGFVRALAEDPAELPVMLEPSCKGAQRSAWLDASLAYLAGSGGKEPDVRHSAAGRVGP